MSAHLKLGLAACWLAACGGSAPSTDPSPDDPTDTPDTPDTPSPPSTVSAKPLDDLSVGACGAPAGDGLFVTHFSTTSCSSPHRMELAGRVEVDHAEYPGHTELTREAYELCQPPFQAYVGLPFWDSSLDLLTLTPSPSTWADGDRTVMCWVVEVNGAELTATARGSRR